MFIYGFPPSWTYLPRGPTQFSSWGGPVFVRFYPSSLISEGILGKERGIFESSGRGRWEMGVTLLGLGVIFSGEEVSKMAFRGEE